MNFNPKIAAAVSAVLGLGGMGVASAAPPDPEPGRKHPEYFVHFRFIGR